MTQVDYVKRGQYLPGVSGFKHHLDYNLYRYNMAAKHRSSSPWLPLSWILLLLVTTPLCTACPNTAQCSCEQNADGQFIINCKGRELTTIPVFNADSQPYYELTLAENSIVSLADGAFNGLNIEKLDLSINVITSVSTSAFSGLESKLRELVLHVNQMDNFPLAAIAGLTNLRTLELKGFRVAILPSGAFSSLTSLASLQLLDSGLQAIPRDSFSGLVSTLTTLEMTSNSLSALPEAISTLTNLGTLKLAYNGISTLPTDALYHNTRLYELDMSYTNLQTVQENAFRGLENSLSRLQLQGNRLTDYQIVPITPLINLRFLDLSANQMTRIPESVLLNKRFLQHLNLKTNTIVSISQDVFQGVANSLQILNLAGNDLETIGTQTFKNFASLMELHLEDQVLTSTLSDTIFTGLEQQLQTLNLRNTGFSDSNWPALQNLAKLKSLTLAQNNIVTPLEFAFQNMFQLETLDLSKNQIPQVNQRMFHGLKRSLQTVDLNDNQIPSLDECVFDKFEHLSYIKLDNNPLHCDCHLQWLRQWLDDNFDDFTILLISWRCSSPTVHQGKLFRNVNKADLVCDVSPTPVMCENLVDPTMSMVTSVTPPDNTPMELTFTNVTHDAFVVSWLVYNTHNIIGFSMEYQIIGTNQPNGRRDYGSDDRSGHVTNLLADTRYVVCLTKLVSGDQANSETTCDDVTTTTKAEPIVDPKSDRTLAIALGVVFGIVGVIILVAVILLARHKCRGGGGARKKQDTPMPGLSKDRKYVPKSGYNSKRFSKPKPDSMDVDQNLEKRLDGFTPEERDRILHMLAFDNRAMSTLSVVSNASSARYLDDRDLPRPNLPGDAYLRPSSLTDKDEGSFYHDIDEQNHYYEIPDEKDKDPKLEAPRRQDPKSNGYI